MGDGSFLETNDGHILYVFRHHSYITSEDAIYRIEVLESTNQGISWSFHSAVVVNRNSNKFGFWSPSLLQKSDDSIILFYDDEVTPSKVGKPGEQFATAVSWNVKTRTWINPVTVSRAFNSNKISRDGMISAIEVAPNHIVASLESVDEDNEHKGVVRFVYSLDGGKTWSWEWNQRILAYQPNNKSYNALSPWLVRRQDGVLVMVFHTDEDRALPGTPNLGADKLDLNIKYVRSDNLGLTWDSKSQTASEIHPVLFPGAVVLRSTGQVLIQFVYANEYWSFRSNSSVF